MHKLTELIVDLLDDYNVLIEMDTVDYNNFVDELDLLVSENT